MIVRGPTQGQVEEAARRVKVRVSHAGIRQEGTGFRLTLVPGAQGQWQRTSASYQKEGHKVNAACWHGYYAFMRELYKLDAHTIISSAMTRYASASDLEHHAHESGDRNIGSQMYPVRYRNACRCNGRSNLDGLVNAAQAAVREGAAV